MTSDAFRDALAKGQGRTALVLQHSDPAPFFNAILGACVENLQIDPYCEAGRGPYVMRLINLANLRNGALDAILEALPKSEESRDRDWMVDLLEEFARGGEERAWEALRDLAVSGDKRAQDDLATVDEAGLEWVEANVLPTLTEDDQWRVGMWLPDEETDDVTPVQHRLRALQKENEARWETPPARGGRPRTPLEARSFLQDLAAGKSPGMRPYEFARLANRKEWRELAERLLKIDDRLLAWRIASAFRGQRFPLPARRLVSHATRKERGAAVCRILSAIESPRVRHLALKLLRVRPLPEDAIRVLESNFHRGDERLVASLLTDVEVYDPDDLHDVVLDLISLFFKRPEGRWQPHAEWVYEHSPCSMCRGSAVDWLVEHGVLPETIREEGAYDAEPDVRERVAEQREEALDQTGS